MSNLCIAFSLSFFLIRYKAQIISFRTMCAIFAYGFRSINCSSSSVGMLSPSLLLFQNYGLAAKVLSLNVAGNYDGLKALFVLVVAKNPENRR